MTSVSTNQNTPITAPDSERRHSQQLYDYWKELCDGRPFPLEEELDPDEVKAIWDDCFLIQLRDIENVQHYNYTYLGNNIINAYEKQQIQSFIPGMVALEASHLSAEFQQVLESGKPMMSEHEYCIDTDNCIRFRQCLLPLGDANGKIASVLGQMTFRTYGKGE